MQVYDKIDVSEGIDFNEIGNSREWMIYYYWHFFRINFSYQLSTYNFCHDMTQTLMSFDDL